MNTAGRCVAIGLLVLLSGFAFALPAVAEPRGDILDVREDDAGNLRVIFVAEDTGDTAAPDPATIKATLDGEPLAVAAERASESTAVGRRVAVLAVDVSGTMRGAGITGAKAAAEVFLEQAPDDVLIGLVTFNDKVTIRVKPTADRARIRQSVKRLKAGGGTALNDAIVRSVGLAGTEGVRSVVVLSDGETDNASRNTSRSAVARVTGAKVKVDAISLKTSATKVSTLRALARAGGGEVVTAPRPEALAGLFAQAAKELDNQLVVTVSIPDEIAGRSGNLMISGEAGGQSISDTAFALTSAREAKAAPPRKNFGPQGVKRSPLAELMSDSRTVPVAIGSLFIGLLLVVSMAVSAATPGDRQHRRIGRRLDMYTLTRKAPPKRKDAEASQVLGDSAVARSAMELAGRVVAKHGLEDKLARKLESGGIPLKPAEWLLIHAGSTIVTGLFLALLSSGSWLWTLLGLVVGVALPFVYLVMKAALRKKAFLAQLPDSLQLLSGSLSAGYSLPQAIDTIVREGQQPLAAEFNRVLIETRLGAQIEDAMEGVADRMRSKDFSWVVMAIRIQREVGGNLAEVLNTVSNTLREREFLRRHVRALSAEGVISAWILCALPPGFMLFLAVARPGYLAPLINDFFGLVLLGVGAFMMVVGIVWMRKVIKVEV